MVDPIEGTCTCPDFETRGIKCKHLWSVEFTINKEAEPEGITRVTPGRKTYSQNWSAYTAAQTHEYERFPQLLTGLCAGVEQPYQNMGRPRLPLADVVFALALKTYSTVSGRRATGLVNDAQTKGFIDCSPHYSSAARCLESTSLTPVIKKLIEHSAAPLKTVEVDFAIDSTGFATNTYSRWFDHKWGRVKSEQQWIKCHMVTGVKTNVITAAEATPDESADAPFLKPLVNRTADTFSIRELSADKAYSSKANLRVVEGLGGSAYIPFKEGTTGTGPQFDELWFRLWYYYHFMREDFLGHYHKRSNVESTVWMVKSKFGPAVRAKLPTAQVNEVLLKILCHNICVLIQSIYELGLEPVFWK